MSSIYFEKEGVCGSWGCLPFQGVSRPGRYWLGIEPRHWHITEGAGLTATMEHSCMLGPYRQMICRLRDGRSVSLHRRHDEPVFQVGTCIQSLASPEHLVMLQES